MLAVDQGAEGGLFGLRLLGAREIGPMEDALCRGSPEKMSSFGFSGGSAAACKVVDRNARTHLRSADLLRQKRWLITTLHWNAVKGLSEFPYAKACATSVHHPTGACDVDGLQPSSDVG